MKSVAPREAIVIGGGQSGLAAAWALREQGVAPLVLEAGQEAVGSWPHYYDSLTLFSPAGYSGLPGVPFPSDSDHYPIRDEVVDYLRSYGKRLDADIHTGVRVERVRKVGRTFTVITGDGDELQSALLIAATGGFSRPFRPALPALDSFTGDVIHSSQYREPSGFAGQRVVVVGGANSAVQIATELSDVADVILATRKPIRFMPQRPLGRDVHFWFTVTGLDAAPLGRWVARPPSVPVLDTGTYRDAVNSGRPDRRPMFHASEGDHVVWADGSAERVDTILLATGYRPDLAYLTALGAVDNEGGPLHRGGVSTTHRGLGYVGQEWQRSLSSATLRGVGRDAAYVVKKLLQQRNS